jgi:hypothetical protein
MQFLLAIREKRFSRRAVKRLLKSHSAVSARTPDLSGKALYREVLLHTQQVDPSHVDKILRQAEDSVDEWTAPGREELGFREVVHFFVVSQYVAAGHIGTVVSFREVVDLLIPADM